MHRTTINLPESIVQRAKIKALRENATVSQVLRDLLAGWVAGDISLDSEQSAWQKKVALARAARGMWADRDTDDFLATSRAGLTQREAGDYSEIPLRRTTSAGSC